MTRRHDPEELLEFPCHYEFKVFGPNETTDVFFDRVLDALNTVVPVSRDAVRTRLSSGGKYQCLTLLATLQNSDQLKAAYAVLRKVEGIRYLL